MLDFFVTAFFYYFYTHNFNPTL